MLRRALLLPNARVQAETTAAERVADLPGANHIARRLAAVETPGDALRRLPVGAPAAIVLARTAEPERRAGATVAERRYAAAAATTTQRARTATAARQSDRLVRRSTALAAAPEPASAPGRVLPGRRTLPGSMPIVARSTNAAATSSTSTTTEPMSTADRLREMVATRAFDAPPGSVPVRRSPSAAAAAAAAATSPGMMTADAMAAAMTSTPTLSTPVLRTAAERFEHVRRTAAAPDRPGALPARFRPLAERIVGPRIAVQVVHGAVTRQALLAAGHDAATTERTIHLPSRPDASARTMSIVAHELEHVAAPSAIPRFHGGVDSPEERQAIRTEQVVHRLARTIDQRGGSAASAGVAGLPVGGLTAFGRSGAGAPDAPPGPPVPGSAVQRAATASGGSSSSSSTTVRRTPAGASASPASGSTSGGTSQPIRRSPGDGAAALVTEADGETESGQAPALSPAQLSAIIRAVEDRLLEEIERRGGLSRGAF